MKQRILACVGVLVGLLLVGAGGPRSALADSPHADKIVAMLPVESAALGIVSTYKVQQGDSLSGIGDLLADDADSIQQLNNLPNPDALAAGQVLAVPDVPTTTVRFGLPPSTAKTNAEGISFVWPAIGPITTPFGVPGSDWVEGYHTGLDIGAPMGSPIVAAADGVVEWADLDHLHGYGNYVLIDNGKGYETLYAHMSRIAAQAGQTIHQGDVIGFVGDTGYAAGPHLHFEVRYHAKFIDPQPLLP